MSLSISLEKLGVLLPTDDKVLCFFNIIFFIAIAHTVFYFKTIHIRISQKFGNVTTIKN